MSAELLRRAATLMRERAEAAVAGPWIVDPDEEAMVLRPDSPNGWDGYGIALTLSNSDDEYTNTQHIASWHPDVALAVADALDDLANDAEAQAAEGYDIGPRHPLLTVARAYLGEAADD